MPLLTLLMRCPVCAGLVLMSAPLPRLVGSARIASTTIPAGIGLPLRFLLVGLVGRPLRLTALVSRVEVPLRVMLLVTRVAPPFGLVPLVGRVGLPLRPLVGRCKSSRVGVPVPITLLHRSAPIGGHVGSHVRPISCSIIMLTVRAIVGIPVQVPIGVACHDVLEAADDDDSEHDPDNCPRD